MSDRLDIIKGVASQRVYFYPPEGRPTTTPSVSIKDRSGSDVTAAATTNVTLDTVSTTLSSGASTGDLSVTLTATTGLEVGATYLLTNTLSQTEWVRCVGFDTSSKVAYLDEPLEHDHASSSTFVGTRFYRTLQTAEVASLAELYRARASYAVGGLNYVLEIPFDVVLTPLPNLLTVQLLKRVRPGITAQEHPSTRGSDFADLRAVAWSNVRSGIRKHATGWRPALLRTPEDVEAWGLAELDLLLWNNGVTVLKGEWTGEAAARYLEGKIERARAYSLAALEFLDVNETDSVDEDDTERPQRQDFYR